MKLNDNPHYRISPSGEEFRKLKFKGETTGNLMRGPKKGDETYAEQIARSKPYTGKIVKGDHSEQ